MEFRLSIIILQPYIFFYIITPCITLYHLVSSFRTSHPWVVSTVAVSPLASGMSGTGTGWGTAVLCSITAAEMDEDEDEDGRWWWVVRFCHRLVCAALRFHFCLRWLSSLLLKVAMFVFVRFLIALGRLLKIFGPWHLMVCFLVFWRWDGVLVRLKILHVLPLRWGISVCSWMHLFGSLLRLGVSSSRIFQMWIARYLALLSSKV